MFNFVLSGVGEAIGNVTGKLKKRSHSELVDQIFRKRLAETNVELPPLPGRFAEPEGETIDVEYRVLDESEEGS